MDACKEKIFQFILPPINTPELQLGILGEGCLTGVVEKIAPLGSGMAARVLKFAIAGRAKLVLRIFLLIWEKDQKAKLLTELTLLGIIALKIAVGLHQKSKD